MSNSNGSLDLNELKAQILESLKTGKPLLGSTGALTPLIKEVVEASLDGELEAHLVGRFYISAGFSRSQC